MIKAIHSLEIDTIIKLLDAINKNFRCRVDGGVVKEDCNNELFELYKTILGDVFENKDALMQEYGFTNNMTLFGWVIYLLNKEVKKRSDSLNN